MKHSLLIVDDFFIDRENAKEILASSDLPITVVGECDDAASALEWIRNDVPSIILSDIEMPVMDGLEFVQNVRREHPSIDLVIYSVHDKFDYAQRALDLGATAYVLKPVEADQLKGALWKVVHEREARLQHDAEHEELMRFVDQHRPILIDRFAATLFTLDLEEAEISEYCRRYLLDLEDYRNYAALAIEADSSSGSAADFRYEEREFLRMRLSQAATPILGAFDGSSLFSHIDGTVFGALLASGETDGAFVDGVQAIADSIIEAGTAAGIGLTVGLSVPFTDLVETSAHFREARECLAFKFNVGRGQVIHSEEIQPTNRKAAAAIEPCDLHAEVVRLLDSAFDEAAIDEFIERSLPVTEWLSQNQYKRITHGIVASVDVALSEQSLSLETVFPSRSVHEEFSKVETVDLLRTTLKDFLRDAVEFAEGKRQEWSGSVADRTKDFVRAHFSERLTVEQIAASVFYSPNYLNNLFKRETGETILEFITRYRISKAKEMLASHEMRINSVSSAVGYPHDSYFRSVFKRAAGVTPSEYREKHRPGKG